MTSAPSTEHLADEAGADTAPDRPARPAPPLIPTPWEVLGRIWRWLRRMSTALLMLFGLALATLIATFIPQEPVIASTVRLWRTGEQGPGEVIAGIFDALGLFDVFGSWWFGALTVLLMVSLTGCLVPRWRVFARNVGKPPVRGRNLTRLSTHATLPRPAGLTDEELLAKVRPAFRTYRTRLLTGAESPGPAQLAIERGHWREFGSLVFHTSFYLLLLGVSLGAAFSFTGQIDFAEGDFFTDTPVGYDTFTAGRLWGTDDHPGHVTTLDDFEVTYLPDGFTPDEFVSTVTFGSGEDAVTREIRVNHPVHHDGLTYYQRAFGFAPLVSLRSGLDGQPLYEERLILRDDGGFWSARGKVSVGNPNAENPLPQIGIEVLFLPDASFDGDGRVVFNSPEANDPRMLVSLYVGDDLGLDRALPLSRLEWPESARVDQAMIVPGTPVALAGGLFEVEFDDLAMWSGLQVSHQPYRWLLLTAASLTLMGLIPSLYAFRRRLWVQVDDTHVLVAGVAQHRKARFDETFDGIVERVADRLGVSAEPSPTRPSGSQP